MKLKAVITGNSVSFTVTDTGINLLGFNLYRSQVAGGPYAKLNAALLPGPTLTDTTVVPGQTYYYVATAVNAEGESPYSNEESSTIPTPQTYQISTQPPGLGLSFSAVAGGAAPAPQSVPVIENPATPLPIAISSNAAWIKAVADSPTTKANITVNIDTTGLLPGTFSGSVIVTNTDGTASNSPFKIGVDLVVTEAVPPAPVIS